MTDYEIFNKLLRCDPTTGKLFWKEPRKGPVWVGKEAGGPSSDGYVRGINCRKYKRSRIVWLLSYKEWPKNMIDHINRVRDDDRLVNLADVTRSQNYFNQGPPLYWTERDEA